MAAPNPAECVKKLSDLMSEHRWSRATMSDPFFRETMERSRIEASFLEKLNEEAAGHRRPFAISKVNSEYILARATPRRFPEDCDNWDEED